MNEKILLIADEEANLRLLTQRLVVLGYDVEFAAKGAPIIWNTWALQPLHLYN